MAKDGGYKVKLWFLDGEWGCGVRFKNKFIGGTMPGQTTSKYRDQIERYAQRIMDEHRNN